VETVDLQVAVKEFHHKPDFTKENDLLQQIKALQHRHIIRHFASIDKGKKGYIIFPWANGGNLQEFWGASKQEISRERAFWAMQQMLGLATALHLLHKHFGCRHGDLKPGNILCVTEGGETVLKIADFGVSKIHHGQTIARKSATTTLSLTVSYQAPEVEFEKVDEKEQRPRSRKYDIWSLGCVFLEFSIWLLHGPEAIEGFVRARGNGISLTGSSRPLYEVTDKAAKAARVHQLVSWTIESLQDDPRCKGETALAALLSLIKDQMLQPEVGNRPSAEDIGKRLESIVQEAEKRNSYLFHSCDGPHIPPLDFEKFQSVPNQEGRP
jgi:serine/threonine protein kinase